MKAILFIYDMQIVDDVGLRKEPAFACIFPNICPLFFRLIYMYL